MEVRYLANGLTTRSAIYHVLQTQFRTTAIRTSKRTISTSDPSNAPFSSAAAAAAAPESNERSQQRPAPPRRFTLDSLQSKPASPRPDSNFRPPINNNSIKSPVNNNNKNNNNGDNSPIRKPIIPHRKLSGVNDILKSIGMNSAAQAQQKQQQQQQPFQQQSNDKWRSTDSAMTKHIDSLLKNYGDPRTPSSHNPIKNVGSLFADQGHITGEGENAEFNLRLSPSLGRTFPLSGIKGADLAKAFTFLESRCMANRVRSQAKAQLQYVRRGQRKKDLRIHRWRKLFKGGFRHSVRRCLELERQGW